LQRYGNESSIANKYVIELSVICCQLSEVYWFIENEILKIGFSLSAYKFIYDQ